MKVSKIYAESYPPYTYLKLNSGEEFDIWSLGKNKFSWRPRVKKKAIRTGIQNTGIQKTITFFKPLLDSDELKVLEKFRDHLKNLEKEGIRTQSKVRSWKTYDLWKEIENHPWVKKDRPDRMAMEWYRKTISTDTDYHFKAQLLRQGFLYTYNYDTPKYKDILDYFDTQPLVIAFGSVKTNEGIRDIGINMHLLPPKIRRIVLYKIFEIYRNHYKDQLFGKRSDLKPVLVNWKQIAIPLFKYGAAFAIRMYIPELRTNTIEFKYEDWASAIYLPSKKLSGTTQSELEKLWKKFVRIQNKKGMKLSESWSGS